MLGVLGFFVVEPYYYYYDDDDDEDHHCYHYRYRLSLTLPLVLKTTPSILKSEWRLPEPAMGPFQAAAGIFRSLPVLGIGFSAIEFFQVSVDECEGWPGGSWWKSFLQGVLCHKSEMMGLSS